MGPGPSVADGITAGRLRDSGSSFGFAATEISFLVTDGARRSEVLRFQERRIASESLSRCGAGADASSGTLREGLLSATLEAPSLSEVRFRFSFPLATKLMRAHPA